MVQAVLVQNLYLIISKKSDNYSSQCPLALHMAILLFGKSKRIIIVCTWVILRIFPLQCLFRAL
jgi:hypothetical protein